MICTSSHNLSAIVRGDGCDGDLIRRLDPQLVSWSPSLVKNGLALSLSRDARKLLLGSTREDTVDEEVGREAEDREEEEGKGTPSSAAADDDDETENEDEADSDDDASRSDSDAEWVSSFWAAVPRRRERVFATLAD